jgi:hypothetical protein
MIEDGDGSFHRLLDLRLMLINPIKEEVELTLVRSGLIRRHSVFLMERRQSLHEVSLRGFPWRDERFSAVASLNQSLYGVQSQITFLLVTSMTTRAMCLE